MEILEKHNNWDEKYTSWVQEQILGGRKKQNKTKPWGTINRNNPIWRTERRPLKKNNHNLWNLWNKIKFTNIFILGIPKGKEKGTERIFEEIVGRDF